MIFLFPIFVKSLNAEMGSQGLGIGLGTSGD